MADRETAKEQETRTLEESFQALEQIMSEMSKEDVSLEESFALYHQGVKLLQECNQKIDTVEKKMLLLDEVGEVHEF